MLIRVVAFTVPGTYQKYLAGDRGPGKMCSPNVNQTCVAVSTVWLEYTHPTSGRLPSLIKDRTCQEGVKIIDKTYNIFWRDGAWYVFGLCQLVHHVLKSEILPGSSVWQSILHHSIY